MSRYAEPMARLIEELKKLPGVGTKSAQRFAFHILRSSNEDAAALAEALADVAEERAGDAYLVATEQQAAFADAVAELEAAGHELRVTGPWPAYSFTRWAA